MGDKEKEERESWSWEAAEEDGGLPFRMSYGDNGGHLPPDFLNRTWESAEEDDGLCFRLSNNNTDSAVSPAHQNAGGVAEDVKPFEIDSDDSWSAVVDAAGKDQSKATASSVNPPLRHRSAAEVSNVEKNLTESEISDLDDNGAFDEAFLALSRAASVTSGGVKEEELSGSEDEAKDEVIVNQQAPPPQQAPPLQQAPPPQQAPPLQQAPPPRQAPPLQQAPPPHQAPPLQRTSSCMSESSVYSDSSAYSVSTISRLAADYDDLSASLSNYMRLLDYNNQDSMTRTLRTTSDRIHICVEHLAQLAMLRQQAPPLQESPTNRDAPPTQDSWDD